MVYLHGSRSNHLLRSMLAAPRVCATFTSFDGLRVARTGFHSSVTYRSVVAFGPVRLLEADDERDARARRCWSRPSCRAAAAEIRRPNAASSRSTTVVALTIEEASAKVSEGPTDDEPEDVASEVWAGDVPAALVYGDAGRARPTARWPTATSPVPPSVRALLGR